MTRSMLDPSERARPSTERARAATRLAGARRARPIGLLDIRKARGDVFLDQLEDRLAERRRDGQVRYAKPTFTKPAHRSTFATRSRSECDAVVEALAD